MFGRANELHILEDIYICKDMQIILLQGEKHIGKTTLLKEFIKSKSRVYYCVRNSTNNVNKASFCAEFAVQSFKGAENITDWKQVIDYTIKKSLGDKVILAIDSAEFLQESFSDFLDYLTEIMLPLKSRLRLYVVFACNDLAYIKNKLESFKECMHIIKLANLSYQNSIPLFGEMDNEEKLILYGVTGGYPEYMRYIDSTKSLKENLLKMFFSPDAPLLNIGDEILRSKLREPFYYHAILCSVSCGSLRMKDIAEAVGENDSKVSKYINVLVKLGLLKKILPMADMRGKTARNSLYVMTNKTLEFWYAYVFPYLSNIKLGNGNQILRNTVLSKFSGYAYKVFLDVCYQHCFVLKNRNNFYLDFTNLYYDYDKGDSLEDIRIIAQTSKEICYMKCFWGSTRTDYDEIISFLEKYKHPVKRCYYVMFSSKGFTEKSLANEANIPNLRLISLRYLK